MFTEKSMLIFRELVKKYWHQGISENSELMQLALEIKNKLGFDEKDLPYIMDLMRIAMGLNPSAEGAFTNELDLVKQSNVIGEPVIAKINSVCEHCEKQNNGCKATCKYEALVYTRGEGPVILKDKCIVCGECVDSCDFGGLAEKIEFLPIVDLLKEKKTAVYALVAPAITGQFGDDVSMGQIRTALKRMGFEDMIEAALFADILTIKEAFEFNHLVKEEKDFFLTSCCCPIWFNMTKKSFSSLYDHMSPSVSPMIAGGRILKHLYPNAKIVFIAPCLAKKGEIKEPDLIGAIDFVLNFTELKEIFNCLELDLASLPSDEKDQASLGGRLYARTGGVSFAVKTVVSRLEPSRVIKLKAKKADGIPACKKILSDLTENKDISANFVEGMGCVGGCVGGPRANIELEKGRNNVNEYGEDSLIVTPFDNLNVMKILKQLGINSIEEIVDNELITSLLTRDVK